MYIGWMNLAKFRLKMQNLPRADRVTSSTAEAEKRVTNGRPRSYVFLHIPKTGGITMYHVLNRQFDRSQVFTIRGIADRREFDKFSETSREQLQLVRGHMEFGIHSCLTEPVSYFTILREPVDRVISHYYYHKTRPDDPIYESAQKLDLKAYVESRIGIFVDNFQTRMLAGKWYDVPPGQLLPEALETAKRHLRDYFAVAGLTERFDETLFLLKAVYDWRNIYYMRHNVGSYRPHRVDLQSEHIDAVIQAKLMDLELYAYAQERFAKQIEQRGAEFARSITSFRRMNRQLQPFLRAYWAFRKVSIRHFVKQLRRSRG
jgi:hypothetical protein